MSFKSIIQFVSLLRVEPFLIILYFSSYFRKTPLEVLIQDKLCRNVYNMSVEFCCDLPYMTDDDPEIDIKTRILSDAVKYNMYHTWITMAPGIVWSIFLGPWVDKYVNGRKAIFIVGSLTQSMEAAMNAYSSYYFSTDIRWILVSFIPYTLSGAMTFTTAYSYVAVTTPVKYRTLRMTALEVLVAIAQPLGVYISGKLINIHPIVGANGQLHNYGLIFTISSLGAFVAFLWAVFVIDQEFDKQLFDNYVLDESQALLCKPDKEKSGEQTDDNYSTVVLEPTSEYIHPLRLLFNINNVREIALTLSMKRPNYVRAQIWLIIAGMFWCYFIWAAPAAYLFQFVEKIYRWDAPIYTEISSLGLIANSMAIIFLAPVLIKVFHFNDMTLAILGFLGSFLEMLALALILNPMGYFVSMIVTTTSSFGPIGLKTHLSKIVDPSELGKVFTLMAVIDGFAPIIAASVFTFVFQMTIDQIPGLCFLILAVFSVIPLAIAMFIDLTDMKRIECNNKTIKKFNQYDSIENGYIRLAEEYMGSSYGKKFQQIKTKNLGSDSNGVLDSGIETVDTQSMTTTVDTASCRS